MNVDWRSIREWIKDNVLFSIAIAIVMFVILVLTVNFIISKCKHSSNQKTEENSYMVIYDNSNKEERSLHAQQRPDKVQKTSTVLPTYNDTTIPESNHLKYPQRESLPKISQFSLVSPIQVRVPSVHSNHPSEFFSVNDITPAHNGGYTRKTVGTKQDSLKTCQSYVPTEAQ